MRKLLFLFIILASNLSIFSQTKDTSSTTFSKKIEFSGRFFLNYSAEFDTNFSLLNNKFYPYRTYLTTKVYLKPKILVRLTTDLANKDDKYFIIPKYAYLQYQITPSINLKFGLIPRAWIHFEEKINRYRAVQTMYVEYWKIVNSTDAGISISGILGKRIKNKEFGRYGSFFLGIFNGNGYKKAEIGNYKTIESRISFRPLKNTDFFISYSNIFGKTEINDFFSISSNQKNNNLYLMHLISINYISKYLNFGGQYYYGFGDYSGFYYFSDTQASLNKGWSIFSEIKNKNLGAYFRYDLFDSQYFTKEKNAFFIGISYKITPTIKTILQYENKPYSTIYDTWQSWGTKEQYKFNGHKITFSIDIKF